MESLQDMVAKIPTEPEVKEEDKKVVIEEEKAEPKPEEAVEPQQAEEAPVSSQLIGVTNLTEWFEAQHESFEDINTIDVHVTGIDSDETILFTVPHPKGGQDKAGNPKRKLIVVENAHIQPVLNLTGIGFSVHPSGMVFLQEFQGVNLNTYTTRSGLVIMSCVETHGHLIPYNKTLMKKDEDGVSVTPPDVDFINSRINRELDNQTKEELILRYHQIKKHIDKFNNIEEVINWFMARKAITIDISHFIQMDEVLIWLVS